MDNDIFDNLFLSCKRGKVNINEFKNNNNLLISNNDDNTCIHILLINEFYSEVLDILKTINDDSFIDLLSLSNKNDETIPILSARNYNLSKYILNRISKINNYDLLNYSTSTNFFVELIKHKHYDLIEDNLKHINFSLPIKQPFLFHIIDYKNIPLIKKSINHNKSILDIYNDFNFSPLIYAIFSDLTDIAKLLIDEGADINYGGVENQFIPINIALTRKNYDLVEYIIDKGANLELRNKHYDTPLHYALYNTKTKPLPSSLLFKLMYNGNINAQNMDGVTPLHMLFKFNLWKDFTQIIKHKTTDINLKDKKGRTFMEFANTDELKDLVNLDKPKYNIELPETEKTPYGLFNSDIIHINIYTILLIKKHKNIIIPYQHYNKSAQMHLENKLNLFSFHTDPETNIIDKYIYYYNQYFFEFLPNLIIWKNEDNYFITDNFDFCLKKVLSLSSKLRFIIIKISFTNTNSTHAGIILIDRKNNNAVRFEPYGAINFRNDKHFDKMMEKKLNKIMPNIKYYSPFDYLQEIRLQTYSADTDENVKNLGDPMGYCLAWVFWFVELRIKYPDDDLQVLIKGAFDKMREKYMSKNPILTYIREYGKKLDTMKNNFLKSIGIDENTIYSLTYNNNTLNQIKNGLTKELFDLLHHYNNI